MERLRARPSSTSRDLKLLWIAIFCLSLGAGISGACNYNFISNILKIQPEQLGYVEAIRETPGFLCVAVVGLLMAMSEPLLASLGICVMGIGTAAYSRVTGVPSLILASWVASLGLHVWQALQSSLVLGLAEGGKHGKRMGQTAGVASAGTICGSLLVAACDTLLLKWIGHKIDFPYWFAMSGAWMIVGSVLMLLVRRNIGHPEKPRFVWKPRYKLYYALTLLEGGRKQVFITFAIYALTYKFGAVRWVIATLVLINQAVNIIAGPIVGRLIDRIGERRIILFCYTSLVFVFIGYAKAPRVEWLYVLYTLDNLLYQSATCLSTYLQKIADPEDLMPTLSMGVSVNHAAAVLVPLIGGYLWSRFAYPVTFYGGAVIVGTSAILATKMPVHKRIVTQEAQ